MILILLGLATSAARAAGCSSADFRLARTFEATLSNGHPWSAYAVADFNGDGKPDLAETDVSAQTVVVLLNDAGRMVVSKAYPSGAQPRAVAAADLNGDGRPDLVVANYQGNSVSVLLNSGGGLFGSATNLTVAAGPMDVAVADFNGDSKPDIVLASYDHGSISLLLGDGSGAFSIAPGSPVFVAGQASGVAVADFNGDGKRDLAVSTWGGAGYFVLLGDGAGRFASPVKVAPLFGGDVAAGDVNGDGKADLIAGSLSGLGILLGDGAGGFSAPVIVAHEGGSSISSVQIADVDGDGLVDVAAAADFPEGITYFKGDGTGAFSRTRSYLSGKDINAIAVADFDSDGDLDLVGGESILLNVGAGNFEAAQAAYPATAGSLVDFAPGDFNADGRMDFATAVNSDSGATSAAVAILLRDSSGNFNRAPGMVVSLASITSLVAADFNKDGRTDIALAESVAIPFSFVVAISLGNGDGTFASPTTLNIGAQSSDMASGDFNNDGNPDLVVVSLQGSVKVLLGNGSGGFTFGSAPNTGTFPHVVTNDLNNDGKVDLVITDYSNQRAWTLMGDGTGSFANPRSFAVGGNAGAVAVSDLNADGKPDVAVTTEPSISSNNQGSVSILLGDGTGALGAATNYQVDVQPSGVQIADLDGDGKLDLAVSNRGSSTISVLSGDGAGAFRSPINFNIWGAPTELVVNDFDSDGRLDLAVLLHDARAVGLLSGKTASAQPCLFADDVTVTEGDSGTSTADVTVRLSQSTTDVVKVSYLLKQSTAIDGQDFTGGGGIITFQPGETNKIVSIPIIGDTTDENDESFTLNLGDPANARISDGIARITILDNDPPPTVSINDVSISESNVCCGITLATFTVSLSAPSAKVVSVNYATANGTAIAGDDFDSAQGTLTFGAGVTTRTLTVGVRGDLTNEPDETFFVNLSNPSEVTIADSQGQGTILNDDPVPTIAIFDSSVSEGVNADTTMNVTVRLSNPSSSAVSVDFAFADDTATGGVDYVGTPGTLTFNPGETQKSFTVTVKDDTIDEINEAFFINLSNAVNATISDGQALCTIFDNDGPTVSINDVSVVEGTGGTKNAVFTLTLSAASPQTIFVSASTADGTAINQADYTRVTNRSLVFPAGSTTATLNVSVVTDAIIEPDETFLVNLSQPSNCTIADAQGVGTIVNDDLTSAQFNTDAMSVNESDGSIQVTIQHVGDISVPFTVNYSTFDGTASQRSDYLAAIGAIQFAAGEASRSITIFLTDDSISENAENFFVILSGPNGARTNTPSQLTVTINANDAGGGPNPIDSPSFFVRQHYRDFLNRDGDQSGIDFWTNQITSCGGDTACADVRRINVSAAFFLSIEFQQTGYLVERMYKVAYGDATGLSTTGGVHQLSVPVVRFSEFLADTQRIGRGVVVLQPGWEQLLENNKQAYAGEFVATTRFLTAFPTTMSPAQFVDKLDQNAGVVLSDSERTNVIALFNGSADTNNSAARAQAIRLVAEDQDLFNRETNRAFVLTQYFGYLRRNPNDPQDTDYSGYEFWLSKLNEFNGNYISAEMVKAFLSASEYRQRFGP